jgi:hypothetical protein
VRTDEIRALLSATLTSIFDIDEAVAAGVENCQSGVAIWYSVYA